MNKLADLKPTVKKGMCEHCCGFQGDYLEGKLLAVNPINDAVYSQRPILIHKECLEKYGLR